MKLYITIGEPYEGLTEYEWTTSDGAASKAASAMKAKFKASGTGVKSVTRHGVEVPTKKEELLVFLNQLTAPGDAMRTMLAARKLTA